MTPYDLLLLALATWYTAYVVVQLDGPFTVFKRIRPRTRGLTECIYCFAPYAAVLWLLIWYTPAKPLIYPFALAGAALMLHRYTGGNHL